MSPSRIVLALLPLFVSPRGEEHICPPCGARCHFVTYAGPGSCGGCGMELVPLASVPQVGVLFTEGTALLSGITALGVFAGSDAVRAFVVSDTDEPLRPGDALEVRPQFSFEGAPALDVLVVPEGYGMWDDPLIVDWVTQAAGKARFVLSIGTGALLLGRAGFLKGARVPGPGFLAQRGKEVAPELAFVTDPAWSRAGKFFLARDAASVSTAALALLSELAGPAAARRTAEELGYEPPAAPEAGTGR